jgi:hypothetical protein
MAKKLKKLRKKTILWSYLKKNIMEIIIIGSKFFIDIFNEKRWKNIKKFNKIYK